MPPYGPEISQSCLKLMQLNHAVVTAGHDRFGYLAAARPYIGRCLPRELSLVRELIVPADHNKRLKPLRT